MSMKSMALIEWIFAAAIVLILVAVFAGAVRNKETFQAVCDQAKGTTVWDGRQYQCIKPQ